MKTPLVLNRFISLIYFYKEYRRIQELNIIDSGLVDKNIAFVTLENSKCFYGYRSSLWQQYLCYFSRFKNLNCEAFNVAFDIIFRYKGPAQNPMRYGKYYDFSEGDTILEVGAYVGYYAMKVSELVGTQGCVVAIEAIPENFNLMKINILKNDITNVELVNKGIYSKQQKLQFYRQSGQRASLVKDVVKNKEVLNIEVCTLDQIIENLSLSRVDFVRIQINGAEIHALQGAKKLLNIYRPIFFIAAPYGTLEAVNKILQENNYLTSIYGLSVLGKPQ